MSTLKFIIRILIFYSFIQSSVVYKISFTKRKRPISVQKHMSNANSEKRFKNYIKLNWGTLRSNFELLHVFLDIYISWSVTFLQSLLKDKWSGFTVHISAYDRKELIMRNAQIYLKQKCPCKEFLKNCKLQNWWVKQKAFNLPQATDKTQAKVRTIFNIVDCDMSLDEGCGTSSYIFFI